MEQIELIQRAIEEMARRENDYAAAATDYANKEAAYRLAKASAFLLAEGTVEQRKLIADKQCWEAMKEKLAAEAVLSIMKEKLQDVRAVLSARQSILSAETKSIPAASRFTT